MKPRSCRSSQFASYIFGPIRKLRSSILPSSRTSVAVSPSLHRDRVFSVVHVRKRSAGTWCTSSSSSSPHSRSSIAFITAAVSAARRCEYEIM